MELSIKKGAWNYDLQTCEACEKQDYTRRDITNKLKKENRNWKCSVCNASQHLTKISTKHGKYGTGAYRSWQKMKDRCLNVNHRYYHRYGGRGISICKEWLTFEGFYDSMGDRPEGYSIERIDNDKGYSPDNCKWLPRNEQQKNRSYCKAW